MNNVGTPDACAVLAAWRERGADRLDPVRFHFIAALARRAAGHGGAARHVLDDRLSKLLQAYGDDIESAACKAGDAGNAPSPCQPARGPLADLIGHIASHRPEDADDFAASGTVSRRAAYPELDVLDYFKKTWSQVSSDRQLRQSLEQVHENAGPLNSSRLVHRSLLLMRELSPGYLHQFLSYAGALSWMEQLNGAGSLAGKDAPRTATSRKGVRGK